MGPLAGTRNVAMQRNGSPTARQISPQVCGLAPSIGRSGRRHRTGVNSSPTRTPPAKRDAGATRKRAGRSFSNRPMNRSRPIPATLARRPPPAAIRWRAAIALSALLLTWGIALPGGVFSAVKKYSVADYFVTGLSFLGLAIPSFLLALVLMYVAAVEFGQNVGGLFSEEYLTAPWSINKVIDLLQHLWIPVVILAVSGTASLIRVMRANMLDELHKPYVTTARAKGLSEFTLLVKYPLRLALNPFISTIAWLLPNLVSGSIIVAIVLSLPTAGPLLLQSLMSQDMYLAGAFILLICALTVLGSLVSDILLALVDPRIRLE